MNMIEIFIIILLQILVYSFGIQIFFDEKMQNCKWGLIILLLGSVIYQYLDLSLNLILYIHVCTIIILFLLLNGSMQDKFWIVIKSVFFIACCIEIIEAVMDVILARVLNRVMTSETKFIIASAFLLVFFIIIGFVKKKRFTIKSKLMNAITMIAMCLMAVVLVLIIECLHYTEPYMNNKKFTMISDILIIASYVSIIILGMFVLYIKKANEKYKYLLEMESLLRKSQNYHYEMILASDVETREFRHDINNHIICLKEMMKIGNYDDAKLYMDQLQKSISQIQKKTYHTGNEIIDAILNYHILLLNPGVDIRISSSCQCEINLNYVDLCSIVSNLLQNAVEALNNHKDGERFLKVKINSGEQTFTMEICNSIPLNSIALSDGVPKTIKQDKTNHGLGLKHVKKLVDKNDGVFDIMIQQQQFRVVVILPINKLSDR
jgi:two-component sensor histidine kinase